ncbi:hypothetical protein AMURIS_01591 [Acetatifactor muris]|uniref:Uncharacterized protein n=1 Tax=Acetatifactor muris TaxID=879566 RepID=A0A2K4ZEI5_9FIRM|nr:hypothetical protein AMURIS_01591 [Acetatifactor muris]
MNMEIILKRILMDCPAYCDSYMRRAESALYLLLTKGIVSFALQKKKGTVFHPGPGRIGNLFRIYRGRSIRTVSSEIYLLLFTSGMV